jgi:hypothetical protein
MGIFLNTEKEYTRAKITWSFFFSENLGVNSDGYPRGR